MQLKSLSWLRSRGLRIADNMHLSNSPTSKDEPTIHCDYSNSNNTQTDDERRSTASGHIEHTNAVSVLDESLEHIVHLGVNLLHLLELCKPTLPALDMLNERGDE